MVSLPAPLLIPALWDSLLGKQGFLSHSHLEPVFVVVGKGWTWVRAVRWLAKGIHPVPREQREQ